MDISKFKEQLGFFKNYSLLLVPAVIGLVSVLLFIPTQLMSSHLKKKMADESISRLGRRIQTLSRNAVASNQWQVEQDYQQAYESDANQTALLAKQSTQRQLLSYKIFPEPKDTSTLIFEEFGQQFCNAVDKLIAGVNALDCPTDAELDRILQSSSGSRGGRGRFSRRFLKMSPSSLSEVDATIVDALCRAKAESACVYINPADLSRYEFWAKREGESEGGEKYEYTGRKEAVEECWYSQLAYWIIEDVIDTIGALNSGSNSVFTSPVKRLVAVSFTRSSEISGARRKAAGDRPSYVLSVADGLTEPCTGRFCNDDIDIVHFNVVVVVSAKAVLPFMQQLCSAKEHKFRGFFGEGPEQTFKHNQITILESKIQSIDREDEAHSLYRYGDDAVVELNLICEYIFNKNGYDEIKPESVKEELKL